MSQDSLEELLSNSLIFQACRGGLRRILCATLNDLDQKDWPTVVEQETRFSTGEVVTPLITAARFGHSDIVKLLTNKFRANVDHAGIVKVKDYLIRGATALWCAAGNGHLGAVKALVAAGADVNHQTESKSTPVRAASFNGRLDIVSYLALHGADLLQPNKYENTCLMIAAYKGHKDIVHFLLSQQVDLDHRALCGATALYFAAQHGHLAIVKSLLRAGASILKTNSGVSPILAAAEQARSSVVEFFLKTDLCELSKEDKIDALELLGASFANDRDNYDIARAFCYLRRAMVLRFENPREIIRKPRFHGIPAYENWIESQNLSELESNKFNANAIQMESLTIRERLLGRIPQIANAVIYRGAVYADDSRYYRCVDLWLHALDISLINNCAVAKDLLRFSQVFSQMLMNEIPMDFHIVYRVVEAATVELIRVRDRVSHEDYPGLEGVTETMVAVLNMLLIVIEVLHFATVNEENRIKTLIFKMNRINARTFCGKNLLHLCVNTIPLMDDRYRFMSSRFPCSEVCELLLECGADVNAVDFNKNTPLHLIASYPKPLRDFRIVQNIITTLIKFGAHIDAVNSLEDTPSTACIAGVAEAIIKPLETISLKCLAARAINNHLIDYEAHLPKCLHEFVYMHGSLDHAEYKKALSDRKKKAMGIYQREKLYQTVYVSPYF